MLESLKNLFTPPAPPQKMAGASFTIYGPLPSMSHAYDLERALGKMNLTGWMRLANWCNIEMEVYGTFQAINDLLQKIDQGTIFQKRMKYEMMWLPYDPKYAELAIQMFDKGTIRIR
jgi:hypothetical protein